MPEQIGEIVEGTVTDVMQYGVFIKLANGKKGLVHISEVSKNFIEDINSVLKKGDIVKAKVLSIDDNGKIALSIKKAIARDPKVINRSFSSRNRAPSQEPVTFDDMLSKFMKDSDEKQLDIKRSFESKRGSTKKH